LRPELREEIFDLLENALVKLVPPARHHDGENGHRSPLVVSEHVQDLGRTHLEGVDVAWGDGEGPVGEEGRGLLQDLDSELAVPEKHGELLPPWKQ